MLFSTLWKRGCGSLNEFEFSAANSILAKVRWCVHVSWSHLSFRIRRKIWRRRAWCMVVHHLCDIRVLSSLRTNLIYPFQKYSVSSYFPHRLSLILSLFLTKAPVFQALFFNRGNIADFKMKIATHTREISCFSNDL